MNNKKPAAKLICTLFSGGSLSTVIYLFIYLFVYSLLNNAVTVTGYLAK